MTNYQHGADRGRSNRYQRLSEKRVASQIQQARAGVEGKIAQGRSQRSGHQDIASLVADSLAQVNDWFYGRFAKTLDTKHLRAVSRQIQARFDSGALGVLLHRVTRRTPDSAGNFIPEYIGMIVIGEGPTELDAISDYEKRWHLDNKSIEEVDATDARVCTPLNPTGQREKSKPEFKADERKGLNEGYYSALSAKIMQCRQWNPHNVGKVMFGPVASPIQPRCYLQYEFVFLPLGTWKDLRQKE